MKPLIAIRQRIVDYFNRVGIRQDIVDLGAPFLPKIVQNSAIFQPYGAEVYDALAEERPIKLFDLLAVNGFIMS